jgi:hypothetical protein
MLKLPFIELIIRLIPEGLAFILSGYALTRNVINMKRFLLSGVLLAIAGYFIRLLPIDYGIHSVLTLISFIILVININKFNVIKSIQAGIGSMIIMFISEGVNVAIIQFILKKDIDAIFADPILKTLYGLPSLLIFASIVGTYYFVLLKRNKLKYV